MWKDSIAEIFVPTGSDGNKGEIATGYPVAPNRVLTAYHAVCPTSAQRDEGRPIEIRWHHSKAVSAWQPVQGIAWEGEQWDLILLDCLLPPEVSPWEIFPSDHKPLDDMRWASVGFPRVGGKRDGVREPFHMKGGVFSMLESDPTFALEADAGPPLAEDWQGASGGPVVVNGRILGVIVQVPPNLEAKRLQAVPMWKVLRDDAEFCRLVGYRQRQERLDRMRQRIEQQLESATDCVDALAAEFPGLAKAWNSKNPKEKLSLLVQRLLAMEFDQLIVHCQKAFRKLGGSPKADPISTAVQTILPAIYDYGVVESVQSARNDLEISLLTLPAAYSTVAEIVMAGVDGRETQYCPREFDDNYPKGTRCLPEPPESGWDGDGMKTVHALKQHLDQKFGWNSEEAFASVVDDFIVRRYAGEDVSAYSMPQRKQLAAVEIEFLANNNQTPYLIVTEPEDVQDRARLENVLRSIRADYPGLMCLSLMKKASEIQAFEIQKADKRNFRPLLDMLPKKQRNTS
jgi:hypothetical protein